MEYRLFGDTGLRVSPVGFGAWQLNNPMWGGPDGKASIQLVHAALSAGCNFFDTAPNYGDGASERLLGEALRERRGEAVICTKFGHGGPDGEDFSVSGLRRSLESSLKSLQTDHVDILLLHSPPPELLDGNQSADLYAELEVLKEGGKLRHYGASVDFGDDLKRLSRTTNSRAAEVLFNAFLQDTRNGFSAASESGMGLIAKVPLDSGWLSGKYNAMSRFDGIRGRWTAEDVARRASLVDQLRALLPSGVSLAQASLSFILAHPEVTTAIPGTKSMEQLEANLGAAAQPLRPDVVAAIHALYESEIAPDPLPW